METFVNTNNLIVGYLIYIVGVFAIITILLLFFLWLATKFLEYLGTLKLFLGYLYYRKEFIEFLKNKRKD